LTFLFLPLMFTLKIRERNEKRDKTVLILGLIISIYLLVGALFKLMHWPGAGFFVYTGIPALLFVFLPIYIVNGMRDPNRKVNTIVTSILIIAGSGFLIVLPNKSNVYNIGSKMNYLMNEEATLEKFQALLQIDSSKKDTKDAYTNFMQAAEDLKNTVTLLASEVKYKDYISGETFIGTESARGPGYTEMKETKKYVAALIAFEEKTGSKIYDYGKHMDIEAQGRDAQMNLVLTSHPNVKDVLSTIVNTQLQAGLVLAQK
jgi:hypothetical protein